MNKVVLLVLSLTFFTNNAHHPTETPSCKKVMQKIKEIEDSAKLSAKDKNSEKYSYLSKLRDMVKIALQNKQNPQRIKDLNGLTDCIEFLNAHPSYMALQEKAQPILSMAENIEKFPFVVDSQDGLSILEKELLHSGNTWKRQEEKFKASLLSVLESDLCKRIHEQCLTETGLFDTKKLVEIRDKVWSLDHRKMDKKEIKIPDDVYKKVLAIKTCCLALEKYHHYLKDKKDLEQYFNN